MAYTEEHGDSFWDRMPEEVSRLLANCDKQAEAMTVLSEYAPLSAPKGPVTQSSADDDQEEEGADIRCYTEVSRWPETFDESWFAEFERVLRARTDMYAFLGNHGLQEKRDRTFLTIRNFWTFRNQNPAALSEWLRRMRGHMAELEALRATYTTRSPGAAEHMRRQLESNNLPRALRDARRRFEVDFRPTGKSNGATHNATHFPRKSTGKATPRPAQTPKPTPKTAPKKPEGKACHRFQKGLACLKHPCPFEHQKQ